MKGYCFLARCRLPLSVAFVPPQYSPSATRGARVSSPGPPSRLCQLRRPAASELSLEFGILSLPNSGAYCPRCPVCRCLLRHPTAPGLSPEFGILSPPNAEACCPRYPLHRCWHRRPTAPGPHQVFRLVSPHGLRASCPLLSLVSMLAPASQQRFYTCRGSSCCQMKRRSSVVILHPKIVPGIQQQLDRLPIS